ncbi:MAG: hypothetical protein U9Q83_02405 [Bacteroidota bacterium]|nr:hypothetical protein [Bacteroidota bacterium]
MIQNLRNKVKSKLKARKYKDTIELIKENTNVQSIHDNLDENLKYLSELQENLKEKVIDTNDYYYGINNIVSQILDTVDKIIGEPDEDWDFVDELTSSLKFNLVDQTENEEFNHQNVVMTKVENGQVSFEYEANLEDDSKRNKSRIRIRKLYEQLNYYEEKLDLKEDNKEKAKIHSIIKAINLNISEENKKL